MMIILFSFFYFSSFIYLVDTFFTPINYELDEKSYIFQSTFRHLIDGRISKKNSFLLYQNGQVIRDNYKKKSWQVIRTEGVDGKMKKL